jgi:hypothetical protein
MGMMGIVFKDARGRGFKVAHGYDRELGRQAIAEEAEWLATASTVPELKGKIARLRRFHPGLSVIEREFVMDKGRGARKPQASRWEAHKQIGSAMRPYGWSQPEYKDDSYVNASGRGWVLVDAGLAHRTGTRLAARAAETLRGVRFHGEKPADLAWALRMEAGRSLPEKTAMSLSAKLLKLPDADVYPRGGQERDPARRHLIHRVRRVRAMLARKRAKR